jgi:hypothetical protein
MPNHITSVIEIREGGILLAARGSHVIRVLGALKETPLLALGGAKEDMVSRVPDSVYEGYYNGSLSGPQQDPAAEPFNPRVASLFITRTGEPLFLQRDPTGEIDSEDSETDDDAS